MNSKINAGARLAALMKKHKGLEIGIYAAIALVIVLLYTTSLKPKEAAAPNRETPAVTQIKSDEERLKNALQKIRGAGMVEVMLTYESNRELVPAIDYESQTSGQEGGQSESQRTVTVTSNGEESAMILKEIQPKIRGVIVVAEGADDIGVRMDLTRAVSAALGVSPDKVEVFPMERKAIENDSKSQKK